MTPVKFSKYLFSFSLFFVLTSLVCAQEMKYVSYFPIPYANHTTLNVKNLALLGTKPGGSIIVGSGTNQSALTVGTTGASTFYTQDLSLLSANAPTGTPEMYIGSASGSVYDGTVNSSGDIGVVNYPTTITNLQAQGTALLRSVYWSGKGGIGKNSSGTADWPAQCDLVWKSLKIEGTDSYMNYLVCSSSGVVDPGTPTGTTSYVPATTTVAAAKYCEAEYHLEYNNWGAIYTYNTLNTKKVSYYAYANSIIVTNDSQYDNTCTCPAGVLDGGSSHLQPADDSSPIAGAATGWKRFGHMKEHDFNFVTPLSLGDCETNLSDQQICDKHCSGSSCNYKCVKAKNIADQCGTPLDKKQCFCPKYGACCGLCEDGSGQPACGSCPDYNKCCTASTCGHTDGCAGQIYGRCGEYTDIRTYEPAIGTATVLYCTATTS